MDEYPLHKRTTQREVADVLQLELALLTLVLSTSLFLEIMNFGDVLKTYVNGRNYMDITVAHLAAHARPLPTFTAGNTLETLSLQRLTHGLVLELVILTVPLAADVALIHLAAVTPHISLTFGTLNTHRSGFRSVSEWTGARVFLNALSGMAHKSLAKIANCSNKLHARHSHSGVFHETIRSHAATLHSSAVRANWKLLDLYVLIQVGIPTALQK